MKNRPFNKSISLLVAAVILAAVTMCAVSVKGVSLPGQEPTATNGPVKTPANPKEKDEWDKINVIASIISALGTMAAAGFALWATVQARNAAQQSEKTGRAMRMLDLWPEMTKLTFLSNEELSKLNQPEIVNRILTNVNTMEKIAFWWSSELLDGATLQKEIGGSYLKLYTQIYGLPKIDALNRSGEQLLKQNPLAGTLKEYFEKHQSHEVNPENLP